MSRPLKGIRVIDWTIFQQGPVASMMLADLGADVIKVEDRARPDPARGWVRLYGQAMDYQGRNVYFEQNNRGKRGIVLNLESQKGKEILYKLVEKSDVFIENHRSDIPEKVGLDYETLSKYNPKLIYASSSAWGPKGPRAFDRGFDYAGQAMSGYMLGGEEGSPPQMNYDGICDQMGASMTAYGIITALLVRELQGIGQKIDCSLLGSMVWLQSFGLGLALVGDTPMRHVPREDANNPLWNHYKCKDDKWVVLANLQSDRFWPHFCRALDIEHLEKDPRFTDWESRARNRRELISIADKIFATKPRDEWMTILKENGLTYSPVNGLSDLAHEEQVLANKYITECNHATWGSIKIPGFPIIFSKTPAEIHAEAPQFGQHTEEILMDILGYDWDDISKLREEEVI